MNWLEWFLMISAKEESGSFTSAYLTDKIAFIIQCDLTIPKVILHIKKWLFWRENGAE